MNSAERTRDASAALRSTLEDILMSIDASSATFSWERAALEERRHRVLHLLGELSGASPAVPPASLVSPTLETKSDDAPDTSELSENPPHVFSKDGASENRVADAQATAAAASTPQQPPPHRLLGNLFSQPPPLFQSASIKKVPYQHGENRSRRCCDLPEEADLVSVSTASSPDPYIHFEERTALRNHNSANRGGHCHGAGKSSGNVDYNQNPNAQLAVYDPFVQRTTHRLTSPSPAFGHARLYDHTSVTPSFWIHVWPCFGVVSTQVRAPTRVLVRGCYRYFEDVVERAAAATNCQPACPSLYTPDGCPVRELGLLVAEQHYLLFPSGGFYRKQAVPTALLWVLYTDARRLVQCS